MKKLLYIAISSQTGGVPKHILDALRHAAGEDYQITVAVPDDGDYYPWFQDNASNVINISLKPYSIAALWKLSRYIKNNGIQLVHSHGKGAGMYARPLKLLCPGIKVVHTFHGIYLERYGRAVRRFYCMIEHILRGLTDVFICVSESEKEEALRLEFAVQERTKVIENGVDLERFRYSEADKSQFVEEFGLPGDVYVIGCVARLEAMKGHICLIQAFKSVVQKFPNSRLVLVGDGPDRKEIEEYISELELESKVILTGFRHDIPQLLKNFDLFISASLKEGMPFTLIEAQAAGVPVVATNVIGNRDIIRDSYNGRLVRSQDWEDIFNGICKAIEEPDISKKYADQGIEEVAKRFTVEASQDKLFKVYEGLLINE